MEKQYLINLFLISNGALWIFLLLVAILMGNSTLLKNRGYDPKFVEFLKKEYLKRSIWIGIMIPVLEFTAFVIVQALTDDVYSSVHLVLLVALLSLLPFPIIDHYRTGKKVNRLVRESGSPVVIDLKFKTFKLIFSPILEFVLGLILIAYAVFILKPFELFYLHLVLPWLFYLTARGTRKAVRPQLKDAYIWSFVFILLNFLLVIYYLLRGLLGCSSCFDLTETVAGYGIAAILILRSVYYISQYPVFRARLNGTG